MLPCQSSCPHYQSGCHKTCPYWKEFQQRRACQQMEKTAYLQYYNELCAVRTRQFRALSAVRNAW